VFKAVYHQIEMPDRNMNWDLLTEPFLDMEPTSGEVERTIRALVGNGFTPEEINSIRSEIEKQMRIYNFDSMLLEAGSLSFFDVLCAMTGGFSNPKQYEDFYWKAMEIEMRSVGKVDFAARVQKKIKNM
jgi:hypothetical protein